MSEVKGNAMDKKYISEMLSIIKKSDMQLREIEIRDIEYADDKSKKSTMYIEIVESLCMGASLSKSWIVQNQLIFLLFDGYLEDMYLMEEGTSFKYRYEKVPETSNMDIVRKNCYRIMKIFRNAITHNLSHIEVTKSGYKIGYKNKKNQTIRLEITEAAVQTLYALIIALVEDRIEKVHTKGHFEGFLLSFYNELLLGIGALEDDINEPLIPLKESFVVYNTSVRCRILNPRMVCQEDEWKIERYVPASSEACDYMIVQGEERYLIPEEIMILSDDYFRLKKCELKEKWKITDGAGRL